ncbi:MAG: DUF3160 domain-containing protein [Byssovorax sp.]
MRRSLVLIGLLALSTCTGRGSTVPGPATTAPVDAGSDAAAEHKDAGKAEVAVDVEGETAGDAEDATPYDEKEKPSPDDDSEQENDPAAMGKTAACSLTQRHMRTTEDAILAAPRRSTAAPARAAWNHHSPPARLELVKARFGLTAPELATLNRQGFVVPSRLSFGSYTVAYHEIYQSELPIYVSADSIFHTIFATNDELLWTIEGRRLAPLVEGTLDKLHEALRVSGSGYPPEVTADLDLYLGVARTLLSGSYVSGIGAPQPQLHALVESAMKADELATVELFGRARVIDFSQYKPRGHYTRGRQLARYFRAAMWLSRLELNLVSRSSRSSQPGASPDPTETPREATDALALADLAERSGTLADIGLLDTAWSLFAGVREDVPLQKLAALRKSAGIGPLTIPAAADRLRAAIGNDFQRTARIHYMPEGSTVLPAITTLLGPRIVADAFATRPLVHGETPDRYDLGIADLAYAFGHDRARHYLEGDLKRYPTLPAQLEKARAIVSARAPGKDLYGAWLTAIRALADPPKGALPSFMSTEAFQDLRLASFVSAYGQLKHNSILLAGQPYDEGACSVPDGYVEPAKGVYHALADYAARGESAMATLDPQGSLGGTAYFKRLGKLMRVLEAISDTELAGEPLSKEEQAFLSMVVEIHGVDIGTGFITSYNGWYFDLFLDRPYPTTYPPPGRDDHPSMKSPSFIADYYTSTNSGTVAYAGATTPRLGVFVLDTGGGPRVVAGPVAHGYEHHGPLTARLTDLEAHTIGALTEPWSASYAVAAPVEPPFVVTYESKSDKPVDEAKDGRSFAIDVRIRSTRALGPVTVDLLDHNRKKVASLTRSVGVAEATFPFPSRHQRIADGTRGAEMMRVKVGEYQAWVDMLSDPNPRAFGGMALPEAPR